MTPVRYPSLPAVIEYNRRHGGPGAGVRDEAVVAGAVARASLCFGGVDAHPTLWDKAAALLHGLASTQGFQDGNKRTAWVTCEAFLLANGYPLGKIPAIAGEVFVLAVSVSVINLSKTAEWLREYASADQRTPLATPFGHGEVADAGARLADRLMYKVGPDRVELHALRAAATVANAAATHPEQEELETLGSFSVPREYFRTVFGSALAQLQQPEPPRNAPCPCGSGRKYKHCHGAARP